MSGEKLWKSSVLNERQEAEVKKVKSVVFPIPRESQVLEMPNGREMLRWYQERLKREYYVNDHETHYVDKEALAKDMDEGKIPDPLPYYIHPIMSTILLHR